jgi:hypothetical protein
MQADPDSRRVYRHRALEPAHSASSLQIIASLRLHNAAGADISVPERRYFFRSGALPAIDEKRGQQILVFFSHDLPLRLSIPAPDTFGDLQYQGGAESRTLRRQRADELEWGDSPKV